MLDPNPIKTPPPPQKKTTKKQIWLSNPKLIKIKTGCTTKNAGLSYRRVFYNSVQPSLRKAMDKFRGEKKRRRRNRTNTISQQTSIGRLRYRF